MAFERKLKAFFKEQERRLEDHLEKNGYTQNSVGIFDWNSEDKLLIDIYKEQLPKAAALGQDFAFENMQTVMKRVIAKQRARRGKNFLWQRKEDYNVWVDFETRVPQAEALVENRALNLSTRWGIVPNSTQRSQIMGELAEGFRNFESIDELKDRITNLWADCQEWRAEMIARTETIRAFNEAGLDYYKATNVVDKVELIIATDACPRCQEELQTQRDYTLSDAYAILPLHPNCRCTWGPLVQDESSLPIPQEQETVTGEAGRIPISGFNLPNPIQLADMRQLNTGISPTWIGYEDGKKYLFKLSTGSTDVDKEVIMSRLMEKVGLKAPKVDIGYYKFTSLSREGTAIGERIEILSKMEWVDGKAAHVIEHNWEGLISELDIKKMEIMDMLTANVDRHGGNYMFDINMGLHPIDHNLAFYESDFVKAFRDGSNASNMNRSTITGQVFHKRDFQAALDEIKASLKPSDMADALAEIPARLLSTGEKNKLQSTFEWRLDNLEALLNGAIEHGGYH